MKRFENEVLIFDTGSTRNPKAMARTLGELGQSGWEVVSVVARDICSEELMVFLKREISEAEGQMEKVA